MSKEMSKNNSTTTSINSTSTEEFEDSKYQEKLQTLEQTLRKKDYEGVKKLMLDINKDFLAKDQYKIYSKILRLHPKLNITDYLPQNDKDAISILTTIPEDMKKNSTLYEVALEYDSPALKGFEKYDLDKDEYGILTYTAVRYGRVEALKHFLTKNPESLYYAKNEFGNTPLHMLYVQPEKLSDMLSVMFETLNYKNIDFSITNTYGNTPLFYMSQYSKENNFNILKDAMQHNPLKSIYDTHSHIREELDEAVNIIADMPYESYEC